MDHNSGLVVDGLPFWANHPTAVKLWEAYSRIIEGQPSVVQKTTRLSLSSVALEAGYQRSTLSRARFPDLCMLIEQSASQKPGKTMHSMFKAKELAAKNLRVQLESEIECRSLLVNQVANLQLELIKLSEQVASFKRDAEPSNIVPISTSRPK